MSNIGLTREQLIEKHPEYIEMEAQGVLNIDDIVNYPTELLAEKEARDLEMLITQESRHYLARTDWMSIREAETGTAMPKDVKAARKKARAAVVA